MDISRDEGSECSRSVMVILAKKVRTKNEARNQVCEAREAKFLVVSWVVNGQGAGLVRRKHNRLINEIRTPNP